VNVKKYVSRVTYYYSPAREEDLRSMVRASGRFIGRDGEEGISYWVLDGKVYPIYNGSSRMTEPVEYFEFCRKIRNRQLPNFCGADDFHLGHPETGEADR